MESDSERSWQTTVAGSPFSALVKVVGQSDQGVHVVKKQERDVQFPSGECDKNRYLKKLSWTGDLQVITNDGEESFSLCDDM